MMALTAPTVTGWSGFWNLTADRMTYSMSADKARAKDAYFIDRLMKGDQTRDVRAALAALIGAAAGGTASATHKRRQAQVGPDATVPQATGLASMGGNILIETVTDINRATTAADITELKKWFAANLLEQNITYPTVTGVTQGSNLVNGVNRF